MRTSREQEGPAAASVVGLGGIMVVLAIGGCAGEPAQPAPTVTPEQVRTHSDRAFEKLKQEERNRSGDSSVPR